jgi:hypothetical protein
MIRHSSALFLVIYPLIILSKLLLLGSRLLEVIDDL